MRKANLILAFVTTSWTIGCTLPKGGSVPELRSEIKGISGVLDAFRQDCGRYPTTKEGFNALRTEPADCKGRWAGGTGEPYTMKPIPDDPWGNPYRYESDGKRYTLRCLGADGKPGGEGENADIVEQG